MKDKILVIVGPTASGKTALSIELAKKYNGEVISADARQVYRGMDIGTGKISKEEMGGIPHHLIDILEPNDVYTAAAFKRDAENIIADIISRGKLPIIAGGTFFYIDTLLGRLSLPEVPPNPVLREKLEALPIESLYTSLLRLDPRRAETIDKHNKVRLVRALEIIESLGTVPPPKNVGVRPLHFDILTLGIDIPKETLHENIKKRLLSRIDIGMIEEVQNLHEGGISWERLNALGLEYRYIAEFLQEKMTKDEMIEKLDTEIRHFAKRQMTWLKRDKSIVWVNPIEREGIEKLVEEFLG